MTEHDFEHLDRYTVECRVCKHVWWNPSAPEWKKFAGECSGIAAIYSTKAAETTSTKDLIKQICDEVKSTLIAKNESYGDSALKPARIFSKSDSIEQIKVRIDDKLSRIMRGNANAYGEDVVMDLIGYFILLRVAEKAGQK